MGWFARKDDDALVRRVTDSAAELLAAAGIAVSEVDGRSGSDTELVTDTGIRFPLHELIRRVKAAGPADAPAVISEHVAGLVAATREAATDGAGRESADFDDVEWAELVRVRLMPLEAATDIGATYPREIAGGLVEMICLDYPTHVSFLADGAFGARDPRDLAAIGRTNVTAEPVDTMREVEPGVWLIAGESPYTASKALDFGALVGTLLPEAPLGVVFGVPHRHMILAHVVTGEESFHHAARLTAMIKANSGDDAPGGGLSAASFYWLDDTIDVAGIQAEDGSIDFQPGRFADLMQRLMR